MLLNFKEAVEGIAKERGGYLSSNDSFKLSKLEREAENLDEAIGEIKKIDEIRLKFKDEDYGAIKKRVKQT